MQLVTVLCSLLLCSLLLCSLLLCSLLLCSLLSVQLVDVQLVDVQLVDVQLVTVQLCYRTACYCAACLHACSWVQVHVCTQLSVSFLRKDSNRARTCVSSQRCQAVNTLQGCSERLFLEGQDLLCTYLAHYKLESIDIISVMMIKELPSLASCRGSLQLLDCLPATLHPTTMCSPFMPSCKGLSMLCIKNTL